MSSFNAVVSETGAEILKILRAPAYILPSLLLPVGFYSLFGIALSQSSGESSYYLATYGVFSVIGPVLFGFGAGVANERERGWLNLKRAVPAPVFSYILAKVIATLLYAFTALALIYIVAGFVAGVKLQQATWLVLLTVHMLSTIPFVFIGLTLGFLFSSNGAVGLANIVFLGMSVLGGLWIPIYVLPQFLQNLANFLPTYHLAEIVIAIVKADAAVIPPDHVLAVGVLTAIFMASTFFAWARQRS